MPILFASSKLAFRSISSAKQLSLPRDAAYAATLSPTSLAVSTGWPLSSSTSRVATSLRCAARQRAGISWPDARRGAVVADVAPPGIAAAADLLGEATVVCATFTRP